jgi:hypothetical protein
MWDCESSKRKEKGAKRKAMSSITYNLNEGEEILVLPLHFLQTVQLIVLDPHQLYGFRLCALRFKLLSLALNLNIKGSTIKR